MFNNDEKLQEDVEALRSFVQPLIKKMKNRKTTKTNFMFFLQKLAGKISIGGIKNNDEITSSKFTKKLTETR
jgi:hypothetical protein